MSETEAKGIAEIFPEKIAFCERRYIFNRENIAEYVGELQISEQWLVKVRFKLSLHRIRMFYVYFFKRQKDMWIYVKKDAVPKEVLKEGFLKLLEVFPDQEIHFRIKFQAKLFKVKL